MGGNPQGSTVMLYVVEGSDGEQWRLLHSLLVFSHSLCYPQSNWALLLLLPKWGVCVRSRPLWVSPTNSPVRLGVSPVAASTTTGVFNQRFETLFPHTGTLGCTVCPWSTSCCLAGQLQLCPPCSTICHLTGSASHCLARLLSAWLAVSTPPTHLDECFFFISLVCWTSIQFDFLSVLGFFVFKLLLSFFWLWEEAQCVYLSLHLGQKFHYTHSYMDHQGHSRDMSCRLYT